MRYVIIILFKADEERLLEAVWSLIRAGRVDKAIEHCRACCQHWRAASLQGGAHFHIGYFSLSSSSSPSSSSSSSPSSPWFILFFIYIFYP